MAEEFRECLGVRGEDTILVSTGQYDWPEGDEAIGVSMRVRHLGCANVSVSSEGVARERQ